MNRIIPILVMFVPYVPIGGGVSLIRLITSDSGI